MNLQVTNKIGNIMFMKKNNLLKNIIRNFSIVLALIMINPAHAANRNPTTKEYVDAQDAVLQSQITKLQTESAGAPTYTIGQHALGGLLFI